jgi:hypothetical protein
MSVTRIDTQYPEPKGGYARVSLSVIDSYPNPWYMRIVCDNTSFDLTLSQVAALIEALNKWNAPRSE